MEDRAEVIRQQMQEKRADLSEKLQSLGEMLPGTEAVGETVESVGETAATVADNVQDTVKTMQQALDLPGHVQKHPWLALGGAVVVGYLAHGYLTARRTTADGKEESVFAEQLHGLEQFAARTALDLLGSAVAGSADSESGSLLQTLLQQLTGGQTEPSAIPKGAASSRESPGGGKPASPKAATPSVN